MATIAIFGSSNTQEGAYDYETAYYLGKELSGKGYDIVTGGYGGIMEAALKGATEGGEARRIGITTDFYEDKEKNPYIGEEIRTATYEGRLSKLVEIGDAYIILPGGTGTLMEMAYIWALKTRNMLKEKPFLCIGEQWHEMIQTMSFYNESVLDSSRHIGLIE